jgi:hypothetical protein
MQARILSGTKQFHPDRFLEELERVNAFFGLPSVGHDS